MATQAQKDELLAMTLEVIGLKMKRNNCRYGCSTYLYIKGLIAVKEAEIKSFRNPLNL